MTPAPQLLEEASCYAAGNGVAMQADIRASHPTQEILAAARPTEPT